MFNVIVTADKGDWDTPNGRFSLYDPKRFGEFSGAEFAAAGVRLSDPASLRTLESIDTLLMYDTVRAEPEADVVLVGHLERLSKGKGELTFRFVQRGTLSRTDLQSRGELIQADLNEFCRVHWAVKDGALPAELFQGQTP